MLATIHHNIFCLFQATIASYDDPYLLRYRATMIKMMLCVSTEKTEDLQFDFPDEMTAGVSMAAGAIPYCAMDEKIEEEQKEEQKEDKKEEDQEQKKEDQKEDNKEDQEQEEEQNKEEGNKQEEDQNKEEGNKQEEERNEKEGNREERVEGEEPKNTNVEQPDSIGLERPISPLNVRN